MMMSIVGGISSIVGGALVGSLVLYTLGIYLSRLPIYNIQYLLFGAVVVIVLAAVGFGIYALVERVGRDNAVVVITDDSMSPGGSVPRHDGSAGARSP